MPFKLPTKEEKADYVLQQFDHIARRYDITNDVISLGLHRLWKQRAVQSLCANRSGRYLDVCCGTGDLALVIAKQLTEKGSVTGLDFSANMLNIATQRSQHFRYATSQIKWVRGDAEHLPFTDKCFDGAIISFGLRNLSDLQQGLREMARVVRPGGKVICLDLGHSKMPVFSTIFSFYFQYVVPVIGTILQHDRQAYTYLPESLKTYPQPDSISKIFREAGLNVIYLPLAFGTVALHIGTKYGE